MTATPSCLATVIARVTTALVPSDVTRFDKNGATPGGVCVWVGHYFKGSIPYFGGDIFTGIAGTQDQYMQNLINWMDPTLLP